MIYLLYGADSYRSREKLKDVISGYKGKYPGFLNFSRFDAEEKDLLETLKILSKGQSLFGEKRLLVVENVFSCSQDVFETVLGITKFFKDGGGRQYLGEPRQETGDILVFWDSSEEAPKDRLEKIFKICHKSQEFKKLDSISVLRWLDNEASKRKIDVRQYRTYLLQKTAGDLWGLKNEIDKIEVGGFTEETIWQERSVFSLTDNFLRNKKEALRCLLDLFASGEDGFRLFAFVANHFRSLLKVSKAMAMNSSARVVTANLGLHPYVVKRAMSEVLDKESFLPLIFKKFFYEDLAIKIGASTPKDSLLKILFFK